MLTKARPTKKALFKGILAVFATTVVAVSAHANCFHDAASRYHVNASILAAIAQTESRMNPLALNRNKNGSYDIGLMQINSTHLSELRKFGITERRLFVEPCTNIHVGAWLLAKNMAIHGNTWKAVGSYNTGPRGEAGRQRSYVAKVTKNLYR